MTDEQLIARLRKYKDDLLSIAADRIEALAAHAETMAQIVEAYREHAEQLAATCERLEAAMIQMRDDRTAFRHAVHFRRFITNTLKGADHDG